MPNTEEVETNENVEYGEVVYTTMTGITNVVKVVIYNDQNNYATQLIHSGSLYLYTKQDKDYETSPKASPLTKYKSVYFNGVLIHKASLLQRMLNLFSKE
jgi:hypothetical protein